MMFANVMDFLTMGGQGVYVWSAYGITFFVLLACVWVGKNREKKLLQRMRKMKGVKAYASRT